MTRNPTIVRHVSFTDYEDPAASYDFLILILSLLSNLWRCRRLISVSLLPQLSIAFTIRSGSSGQTVTPSFSIDDYGVSTDQFPIVENIGFFELGVACCMKIVMSIEVV
ncbi:unnamed protein product [Rhodiola kirilowii]